VTGRRHSETVSVVVPVYNSQPALLELVERVQAALFGDVADLELILVNDGSRDRSWETIADLARTHRWVRGINLMRNYGQHNALLCGIRAARHEFIVTMDADLQHPPEEMRKLLGALGDDNDVVYGTPQRPHHDLWRRIGSWMTRIALRSAMGAETARKASAFRAFRRELGVAFVDYRSPFISIDVVLTWGTNRFAAVPVRHDPSRLGASNYTFRSLVTQALNMMTGFSTLPLQVASLTGFAFTLFGVGVLAYVIGRYFLEGTSVPGFPFLASVIALFAGAQLFALGIIGEYLARMHFRMMERPAYAVRSEVSADESDRNVSV